MKLLTEILCFLGEEPACNFVPRQNEKFSCLDDIWRLSCTLSYAANATYVVANMIWSKDRSPKGLHSFIETSTSANITTVTSILSVVRSLHYIPVYHCNATFRLTNNLPYGFATNKPDYSKECSPNTSVCKSCTVMETFIINVS